MLIARQRQKEKIDRQAVAVRLGRFQQMQAPIQKRHVAIGRNDVSAIRLHLHAILDLEHLHARVAADQIAENAFVVGGQVLYQHEGHAGIGTGRHAGKKCLECRQPAGRGADADDRKTAACVNFVGFFDFAFLGSGGCLLAFDFALVFCSHASL